MLSTAPALHCYVRAYWGIVGAHLASIILIYPSCAPVLGRGTLTIIAALAALLVRVIELTV